MERQLHVEIQRMISKEIGKKLGISERVEYEKIWKFIEKLNPCMVEPSEEFIEKHQVNRRLGTIVVWQALEEWEKQKTAKQLITLCDNGGCFEGKVKTHDGLADCPQCNVKGFIVENEQCYVAHNPDGSTTISLPGALPSLPICKPADIDK